MTRSPFGSPTEILLVEDNLDDARVTIQALKDENIHCRVSLVRDGEEALSFLRREGVFAKTPQPDVILLDMELPKIDGPQVLSEIRRDERLQSIPVLVMTGSAVHRAVLQAQDLRIDGFMTKPISLDQFLGAVKALRRSRLSELVLPAESRLQKTAAAR
jgi:two-component system, chemotaxis family, response regulator Rcp1